MNKSNDEEPGSRTSGVTISRPLFMALIAVLIAAPVALLYLTLPPQGDGDAAPLPRPQSTPTFDPTGVYQSKKPKISRSQPGDPCIPLHFGFDGNPRKFRTDILGTYRVSPGRLWRFTNVSLLAERHHGGPYAVAGEWTVQLGAFHDGEPVTVAESSLDNGSGLALQGQGRVDATFDEGDKIVFSIWLRPGTWPPNYYYTLGASGLDCPA